MAKILTKCKSLSEYPYGEAMIEGASKGGPLVPH